MPFQLVSVLKDFCLLRTRGCRARVWAKSRMRQRGIRTVISNRPDRFFLNRDNLVKTGLEARQTLKKQIKMPIFRLESPRPCTIFCFALIHYP